MVLSSPTRNVYVISNGFLYSFALLTNENNKMNITVSRTEFHQNLRRNSGLHGKVNYLSLYKSGFFYVLGRRNCRVTSGGSLSHSYVNWVCESL